MSDGTRVTSTPRSEWAIHAAADPGADTVAALDAADPTGLAGPDLIDAIVTCERAISHLQATQATLTAAFARPGVAGDLTGLTDNLTSRTGAARGPDGRVDPDLLAAHQQDYARSLASAEIAAALAIPHRTATGRVSAAVELVDQLPTTWSALHDGRIDQRRVTLIADGTRCLPTKVRAAAEDVIVPLARTRVSSHVKELLERAVIAADPDAAARHERDARAHRHVRHRPGENGTGDIHAHLRAEDAVTLYTLLDLLAQAGSDVPDEDGQHRDIDTRRADALADIAAELLATGRIDLTHYGQPRTTAAADNTGSGGDAPAASEPAARPSSEPAWRGLSRHGRRPHLTITIGMSTLAGLDRLPGHLAGHGAITAELATTIARAHQTLALAGIDGDSGTAQAVSATVYRPRQSLADQITTLATHCRFPSCRQPGWRTDHDHRIPFNHGDPASGGRTELWDCDPECRRHHLFKTHAQWIAEGRPDHTIDWTSPTGHHYTTHPTEYRLPGESTDLAITELILPATWPPPEPEPPDEPSLPAVAPPSPEMLHFIESVRRREQHLARLRSVGLRACRILAGYRPPTPEELATARARPDTIRASAGPSTRRRRPTHRDYLDNIAVDRAMRRATGQPDPNDEPPPF